MSILKFKTLDEAITRANTSMYIFLRGIALPSLHVCNI
jgi:hypothetical protein